MRAAPATKLRALQRRLAPNVFSWTPRAKVLQVLDSVKAVSAAEFGIPWFHLTNIRRMQTEADATSIVSDDDKLQPQQDNSKSFSKSVEMPSIIQEENTVQHKAISNLKTSTRHDLALVFTCKVCETRSIRTVCRESYDKGVVVVRCGGCNNLHLIADRLGWFGEPGSVEDLLAARGEEVKKGSVDTLNLTLEDLAGTKLP